jgi:type I restriction enzyme S subunit
MRDNTVIAEFEQIVNPTLAALKNLMARNVILRRARDLLLPRLVSGALDVAGLDIGDVE